MTTSIRGRCWLVLLTLATGCGGPVRELHPISGDAFTLFPPERREPPEITCSGSADARFACFADEIADRAGNTEASGVLALLAPDGPRTLTVNEPDAQTRVDDTTRFPLASATKMFIGATVVSLADDGVVDLHHPIAEYLPELDAHRGPGSATLHQLLTHTSGMPLGEPCKTADEDIDDAVRAAVSQKLWAPPGAVFSYSNVGYTLVAAVIERVTDKPFEQAVRSRVLAPSGIPDATFDPKAVTIPGQAPEDIPAARRCRAMRPAGGLALNVVELSHWLAAVSRPETSPLGAHVVETIGAAHVRTGGRTGEAYGYGIMQFAIGETRINAHGGLLPGYSAFVAWAPQHQVAAGALANTHGSLPAAAVARVISTFLDLPADWNGPARAEHPLASYAGVYADRAGGLDRVRISVEGDHLAIDYVDRAPPLLPTTFRFFFDEAGKPARYVATEVGVGEREGPRPARPKPAG